MAHHTYKTRGWVMDGTDVGEAHRYATLFTEELGLVRALVRSVRTERSKLRYHVQTLSLGEYALVRGKDAWRLTGARVDHNLYYELAGVPQALRMFARYAALLKRLLGSEDPHPELLSLLEESITLARTKCTTSQALENLEYVLVLRTLLLLGYLGEHRFLKDVLTRSPITVDMLEKITPLKRQAVAEINRALRESQL